MTEEEESKKEVRKMSDKQKIWREESGNSPFNFRKHQESIFTNNSLKNTSRC